MKRRYKRRRRTRYSKRKGRRQRYKGKGNATEIKYRTLHVQNYAAKLAITGTDSDTLYGEQNYYANLLNNIAAGAQFYDRVGSKIYVMYIKVRQFIWSCPADATRDMGTFHVRHIWHNQRQTAGAAIPQFFYLQWKNNFVAMPDRKSVTIHKDQVFLVRAYESTSEHDGVYETTGGQRFIQYSIPINRYVQYTTTGVVKEDYNVYSFAMLCATPGIGDVTNNGKQVGCFNAEFRIYFKDA